jgi:hypothetical protein
LTVNDVVMIIDLYFDLQKGSELLNSNRPQPARSPYEWIKRPNFQSRNLSSSKEGERGSNQRLFKHSFQFKDKWNIQKEYDSMFLRLRFDLLLGTYPWKYSYPCSIFIYSLSSLFMDSGSREKQEKTCNMHEKNNNWN